MTMAEAVHKTGNAVLIDKYAQKTALRLGVSPEAVRAEFKKVPAAESKPDLGRRSRTDDRTNRKPNQPVRRIMNFIC